MYVHQLINQVKNLCIFKRALKVDMPHVQTISPLKNTGARQPLKRAANLSLSANVLNAARALDLNISQVCDTHLRQLVAQEQERRWRTDHAGFIAAYNVTVETEGLPLEQWRTF